MELNLLSGNDFQRSVVRQTLHSFLNLPFDQIPFTMDVEFIKDPNPESHNEFADTAFTYGSREALVQIAQVAPNWLGPWHGVAFFREVVAHESGHAFFAALPADTRSEIAQMFGAKSDDLDEINPKGANWENRIIEGIAETFKDAFLPQRLRRYANRTNKRIPIHRYPEFRRIWRRGLLNGGSLAEQMSPEKLLLPAITSHVAENPVGPPWVQWPGTEHIGRVWPPGGSIISSTYGSPVTSGSPQRVGALYEGSEQQQPFGATVFFGGEWNTFGIAYTPDDRRDLFFGADVSGDGYSMTLYKRDMPTFGTVLFDLQIIRWLGGTEAEVMLEVEERELPVSGFSFGVSVISDQITMWVMDPKMQEVGSVSAPVPVGLLGLGIKRDAAFTSNSLPRLGNIRGGPLVLPSEIVIPPGETQPTGMNGGTRRSRRKIVGRS